MQQNFGKPLVEALIAGEWPELEGLLKAASSRIDCDPEMLLTLCESGTARLLMNEDFYAIITKSYDGSVLLIQALVARHRKGNIFDYLPLLERIAQWEGVQYIRFYTRRRGFERRMPSEWKPRTWEWSKTLERMH